MEKFKNLVSKKKGTNINISHEKFSNIININYTKSSKDFLGNSDYVNFIKRVERSIRFSKEYKAYISYIKDHDKINFNKCALHSNLTSDKVKLEMHHGPLFTLFDYVEINMIHLFKNNKTVTSAILANNILHQHKDNLITIVMLCKNDHIAAHAKNTETKPLFIPIDVCWGDSISFLEMYKDALQHRHLVKINKYLERYKQEKEINSSYFIEKVSRMNLF